MWLADAAKDSVGNKTFEVYADIVEKHLIPGIGDHKLKVLSPLHLDQYYKKAEKTGRRDGKGGLSKRSVVHHHRVLFNALERAVKWQLIASNPAIKAEPPKPKKTKIEFLEKEDVPLLLKAAKETPMFTLVFLALNTGMRRGELLGLRWSDIDLDQGFLAVNQTLQFTRANGLEFKPPKTEAGERTITLPSIAVEVLRTRKAEQLRQRMALGLGRDENALVFTRADQQPVAPYNITKEFNRIVKRSGVKRITFHGLRHTHISHLIADGIDIKTVSERAGHASASITLDVYAHVLEKTQELVAQTVDAVMRAALEE